MPKRDPRETRKGPVPLDYGKNIEENNLKIKNYFSLDLTEDELKNLHKSVLVRQPIFRKIAEDEKLPNYRSTLPWLGRTYAKNPYLFKVNEVYKALIKYIDSKQA